MSMDLFMSHTESDFLAYLDCVKDLLDHEDVMSMANYTQHNGTEILEHAMYVSYLSYRICRKKRLDFRSAARGGLLHDFFLYQRRVNKPYKGWHYIQHPRRALKNALERFELNAMERDIIGKHMWPMTLRFPRYYESYIVSMVDKYCCVMEAFSLIRRNKARMIKALLA